MEKLSTYLGGLDYDVIRAEYLTKWFSDLKVEFQKYGKSITIKQLNELIDKNLGRKLKIPKNANVANSVGDKNGKD